MLAGATTVTVLARVYRQDGGETPTGYEVFTYAVIGFGIPCVIGGLAAFFASLWHEARRERVRRGATGDDAGPAGL